jgi:hypothetical protein
MHESSRCFAQLLLFKALFFSFPAALVVDRIPAFLQQEKTLVRAPSRSNGHDVVDVVEGSWMTCTLVPTNQDTNEGVFRKAIEQERKEDSPKILLHVLPKTSAGAFLSRGKTFIFLLFFSLRVLNFVKLSIEVVEFQKRQLQ